MPKISITSLKREIFCPVDTQNVLKAIHNSSIDWMHACGAKGRCTTCCMIVIDGLQNLTEPTKSEVYYRNLNMLRDNERLACQCNLTGDIRIEVPKSTRFPHIQYFD